MAKTAAELEEELTERLLACSLAARGLFFTMRHLIDEETRRLRGAGVQNARPGHLLWNGRPMSGEVLARKAGAPHDEVSRTLAELESSDHQLIERDGRGAIILPAVTRIGEKLSARAAAQRKYAKKQGSEGDKVSDDTGSDTPSDTPPDSRSKKQPPPPVSPPETPSSYPHPRVASPRTREAGQAGTEKPAGKPRPEGIPVPAELDTPEFREAWSAFNRHRKLANDKNWTAEAAALNLKKCLSFGGVEQATANVLYSIERAWRGVYPIPKSERKNYDRSSTHPADRRAARAAEREFTQADAEIPDFVAGGSGADSAERGSPGEQPADGPAEHQHDERPAAEAAEVGGGHRG